MHLSRLQLWTRRQRFALLIILVALLGYATIRFAMNRGFVDDPQPSESSRAGELADRIDPNTADEPTLAALPTLGEKRAKLIVEYRALHDRPGHIVFQTAQDLLSIRGIGVSTLDQIKPFLIFPESRSTTSTKTSAITTASTTRTQG